MIRRKFCGLLALTAAAVLHSAALAAQVAFSLNLEFITPGDFNSGGTWTIVGKADERGLAGASLYLNNINFNASGFLAPMEFEVQEFTNILTAINIVAGDDPTSNKTLDVGVIGGPFPSNYIDDPGLAPFGGNPDLGSFTDGVALATGTFNAGVVPSWAIAGLNFTDANVYSTLAGNPAVDANTQVTIRHVIPEPATIGLAGVSALAVLVIARRRVLWQSSRT